MIDPNLLQLVIKYSDDTNMSLKDAAFWLHSFVFRLSFLQRKGSIEHAILGGLSEELYEIYH